MIQNSRTCFNLFTKQELLQLKKQYVIEGYRGVKEVLGTIISIPGSSLKRDSEYQKKNKRENSNEELQ